MLSFFRGNKTLGKSYDYLFLRFVSFSKFSSIGFSIQLLTFWAYVYKSNKMCIPTSVTVLNFPDALDNFSLQHNY